MYALEKTLGASSLRGDPNAAPVAIMGGGDISLGTAPDVKKNAEGALMIGAHTLARPNNDCNPPPPPPPPQLISISPLPLKSIFPHSCCRAHHADSRKFAATFALCNQTHKKQKDPLTHDIQQEYNKVGCHPSPRLLCSKVQRLGPAKQAAKVWCRMHGCETYGNYLTD